MYKILNISYLYLELIDIANTVVFDVYGAVYKDLFGKNLTSGGLFWELFCISQFATSVCNKITKPEVADYPSLQKFLDPPEVVAEYSYSVNKENWRTYYFCHRK